MFGDYANFMKYSSQLLESIDLRPQEGCSSPAIAWKSMALVHGIHPNKWIDEDSYYSDIYKGVFKKLAMKEEETEAQNLMYLHSLIWSNTQEKLDLLMPTSSMREIYFSDNLIPQDIEDSRQSFNKFLIEELTFDENSKKWLKAISCLHFGDTSRLDDIFKEYGLPLNSLSLLQSICSQDMKTMEPLFKTFIKKNPYIKFSKARDIWDNDKFLMNYLRAAYCFLKSDISQGIHYLQEM